MTHQVAVHSIEEIDELPSGKFVRTLKLRDGFALGLTVSAVALASIGGCVATLGAWAAAALWAPDSQFERDRLWFVAARETAGRSAASDVRRGERALLPATASAGPSAERAWKRELAGFCLASVGVPGVALGMRPLRVGCPR
jgi:hypothetical protein